MRRRLDLAASLIGRPQVLVLDEPTAGLDPTSRRALWATIRSLVEQGTTALLTTQYLEETEQLADDIVVLDNGHVVAQGTPDRLKAQVGGHRVEVQLADPSDTIPAIRALEELTVGPPLVDEDSGRLVIPIPAGAAPTTAVLRRLDAAGIGVAELVVRRPTLDDVFLALTGSADRAEPLTIGGG